MNKKLLVPVLICVLVLPGIASASLMSTFMDKITEVVSDIFFGLAIICIIYAGILFLTAAGEPDKISKAKAAFVWGVVGIAVGLSAWALQNIITAVIPAN